jgi:hypothetical protein
VIESAEGRPCSPRTTTTSCFAWPTPPRSRLHRLRIQRRTWIKAAAPTDDDKAFFSARFVATFAGTPYWWVKERYVALAAELGTVEILPALSAIANERGETSADRTREPALRAIAKISGWDPMVGPRGEKRTLDEAASAANACAIP